MRKARLNDQLLEPVAEPNLPLPMGTSYGAQLQVRGSRITILAIATHEFIDIVDVNA